MEFTAEWGCVLPLVEPQGCLVVIVGACFCLLLVYFALYLDFSPTWNLESVLVDDLVSILVPTWLGS